MVAGGAGSLSSDRGGEADASSGDRAALGRLRDLLEASPRPAGLLALLRRARDIRRARGMLEWEGSRHEGPEHFIELRDEIRLAFTLVWASGAGAVLFSPHHFLSLARLGLYLVITAVPMGAAYWWLRVFPARLFRSTERHFAAWLERARALPPPTQSPGPRTPARPPAGRPAGSGPSG